MLPIHLRKISMKLAKKQAQDQNQNQIDKGKDKLQLSGSFGESGEHYRVSAWAGWEVGSDSPPPPPAKLAVLCRGRSLPGGAASWHGPGTSDGPRVMCPTAVPSLPCWSLHPEPGSSSVPPLIM